VPAARAVRRILVGATLAGAVALAPSALAATKILDTTVPAAVSKKTIVTVTTRKPAFGVTLRVGPGVVAQLYLKGKHAPKSSAPLIDTADGGCPTLGDEVVCRGSYEKLPAGRYTWKLVTTATAPAHVRLKIHW